MEIKKELAKSVRNSIRIEASGNVNGKAVSRIGGRPDVPADFKWEYYEGEDYLDKSVKKRPLSFIAQFDLAEISRFDTENLLPKTGLLSFFYEMDTQRWGFDPKDKGCARVYWFEDINALHTAEFPDDLEDSFRLPAISFDAKSETSFQSYEDFMLQRPKMIESWDEFDTAAKSLGIKDVEESSKLLGWADPIQGNMTMECELVNRGYYLGDPQGWSNVTPRDRQEAEQWANRDWLPLLQLDSLFDKNGSLQFGDDGRIYFYIRRDDLAARNFNNVWLILQCF